MRGRTAGTRYHRVPIRVPDPLESAMLDERKASILRAVVEEYIHTAQPVGSGHVAQSPGVEVSSATVRNDMALLEQEGYLAPAAHQRRPGAHRQGLPLLRRRAHGPGPARQVLGPPGPGLLRHHPRRARADAARHHPPAVRPHALRRGGGGAHARGGRGPLGAPRAAWRRPWRCWWSCSPTASSRSAPSSWPTPATEAELADAAAHLSAQPHRLHARGARHGRPVGPPGGRPGPGGRASGPGRATPRPTPSRSTWAARPAWPRRSTRSTPSARCSTILEQQLVVVSLIRDVLDRGLQVAIGSRERGRPAGRLLARRRPLPGRR